MKSIQLISLQLAGFGRYRQPMTIKFYSGLTTYIAPNEGGKSTIIAGLLAVLFGLPAINDQKAHTIARYKNWDGAPEFCGIVKLKANDQTFTIDRRFSDHAINAWNDSTNELLVTGTHNPRAQKKNAQYIELLTDLFGITDRELFAKTFCIGQPVPEPDEIDQSIQQLIIGSSGSVTHAHEYLSSQLGQLTRYVKNRIGAPRDLVKDRTMEQQQSELVEIREKISAAAATIDQLEPIHSELSTLDEQLEKAGSELSTAQSSLNALTDWQRLSEQWRQRLDEQTRLKKALQRAEALTTEHERLDHDLKHNYPEFEQSDLDVAKEQLDKLATLQKQRIELNDSLHQLNEQFREATGNEKQIDDELSQLGNWIRLAEPIIQLTDTRNRIRKIKEQWDLLKQTKDKLAEINENLTRYAQLDELTSEQIAMLEQYDKLWQQCKRFKQQFSDLSSIHAGKADDVRSAAQLSEQLTEVEGNILQQKNLASPNRYVAPVIASGIAATCYVACLFLNVPTTVTILLTIGGSIAGYTLTSALSARRVKPHVKKLTKLQAGRDELKSKLEHLKTDLNILPASPGKLYEIAQKLQTRDQQWDQYGDDVYEDLKHLASFTPGTSPSEAIAAWKELNSTRQQLQQQLDTLCQQIFGCSAKEYEHIDPATASDESWQRVAQFFATIDQTAAVTTTTSLINYITNLTADWWLEAEQSANRCQQLCAKKQQIKEDKKTLTSKESDITATLAKLDGQIKQQTDICNRYLSPANNDIASAQSRLCAVRKLTDAVDNARTELTALLTAHDTESIETLRQKETTIDKRLTLTMNNWEQLVTKNPGLPPAGSDDIERISVNQEKLEQKTNHLASKVEQLQKNRDDLLRKQASLSGQTVPNIAVLEQQLHDLTHQQKRDTLIADALTVAANELRQAQTAWQTQYRQRLERIATTYFQQITSTNRKVLLSDQFAVTLQSDRTPLIPAQLSKGAQDQLYLALRLALADLISGEISLPLICDDPFANCDQYRRQNIKQTLQALAENRQIILVAHQNEFASWGQLATIETN